MALIAAHLNAEVTGDSVATLVYNRSRPPLPYPLPPGSSGPPSLISLMVSVDVKHISVYFCAVVTVVEISGAA